MALVDCLKCGRKISSKASQCPNCSTPREQNEGVLICNECQAQVPKSHSGACPSCGNPSDVPAHDFRAQIEAALSADKMQERKALIVSLEEKKRSLDTTLELTEPANIVVESFGGGCIGIIVMLLGTLGLVMLGVDDNGFVATIYRWIFAIVVLVGLVLNPIRFFIKVIGYKRSARDKKLEMKILRSRIDALKGNCNAVPARSPSER